MDDMRQAAQILKGHKVHPDVLLNITPASTEVYCQCLKEGILETFIDAGVFLPAPSCGQCSGGANTPLDDDDVCLSTGICNYPGRMGNYSAEIYLCSPATAAASAVAGYVTDPATSCEGKSAQRACPLHRRSPRCGLEITSLDDALVIKDAAIRGLTYEDQMRELSRHCLTRVDPQFPTKVKAGYFLVGNRGVGWGA